jgi:hypothetical protein
MSRPYLYFAISVSGASVLAVEILGTRILGPHFGVSLYLWSALITVTLAALALGYALGGLWADRGATMRRLCLLLAAGGAWIVAVPWLGAPGLRLAEPAGMRAAMLLSAFVLFFPPLMLLGMATPYAVKLRAVSVGEVGRAAGDYREDDELAIMKALQKSTPDIIVVGSLVRGAELWIPRHMHCTKSGIFLYADSIMEILAGRR